MNEPRTSTDRPPLRISDTVQDISVKMAEGNIGAMRVILSMTELPGDEALISLVNLDDMNIRGAQLWVAWKDWARCDMAKLIAGAKTRDPELVNTVRRAAGDCGGHVAVASGASFKRPAMGDAPGHIPTRFQSETEEW